MKVEKVRVEEYSRNDIIIAVIGPPGSGKSTFIEHATKQKGHTVGHELQSCTTKVRAVRAAHPGTQESVVFIDTPGFDEPHKPETEILHMIADWLDKTYKNKTKLTGIICMHRISDNRVTWLPSKNIRLFAKLCYDEAIRNVILATTMWSLRNEEAGLQRQQQLIDKYWKPMLDLGSKVDRFHGTPEDAWRIVSGFNNQRSNPFLQEGPVDRSVWPHEAEPSAPKPQQPLTKQKELAHRPQRETEKISLILRIRRRITC